MRPIHLILCIAPLLSACVGQELRRTASLTAAEVQSFDTALVRFDRAHHGAIDAIDDAAGANRGIADATDQVVTARVTELDALGRADAVRLFASATPPVRPAESEPPPIAVPAWSSAPQAELLEALSKVSAKRTDRESTELLLGFALDVAKGMKKDADAAATPNK